MGIFSFKAFVAAFAYLNVSLVVPEAPLTASLHSEPPLGPAREIFKIGPWVGAEQFLQDGTFFSCLMVADYGAGRSAAFGINDNYRFWFGLSSQDWQFSRGKNYKVAYAIDSAPQVAISAFAPNANMLMADFANATESFGQLKNAQILKVIIPDMNETVEVRLYAVENALSALAGCVNKNETNTADRKADRDL